MKILESGKKKNPKTLTGSCVTCRCKVETDTNEATFDTTDPREPGAYRVKCPECGNGHLWVA